MNALNDPMFALLAGILVRHQVSKPTRYSLMAPELHWLDLQGHLLRSNSLTGKGVHELNSCHLDLQWGPDPFQVFYTW